MANQTHLCKAKPLSPHTHTKQSAHCSHQEIFSLKPVFVQSFALRASLWGLRWDRLMVPAANTETPKHPTPTFCTQHEILSRHH
jgi:hypothetical protein